MTRSSRSSRCASVRVLLVLGVLLPLLAGCRTSYTVRPPLTVDPDVPAISSNEIPPSPAPEPQETDPIPFLVARADLEGAEATIQMRGGRAFPATVLRLQTDGLVVRPDGEGRQTLALDAIRSVIVTDSGRGGLQGLGGGFVGGVAGGGLLGLIVQPFGSGFFALSPAANAAIVALFMSAVTVPLGGLIGAGRGQEDVYYFAPAPASSRNP